MVRVDPEDNIRTTDIGSYVVLKLSPEGCVLLALGRMRIPGDDGLHFNQPTDVCLGPGWQHLRYRWLREFAGAKVRQVRQTAARLGNEGYRAGRVRHSPYDRD
jgi:hypothetical protein